MFTGGHQTHEGAERGGSTHLYVSRFADDQGRYLTEGRDKLEEAGCGSLGSKIMSVNLNLICVRSG